MGSPPPQPPLLVSHSYRSSAPIKSAFTEVTVTSKTPSSIGPTTLPPSLSMSTNALAATVTLSASGMVSAFMGTRYIFSFRTVEDGGICTRNLNIPLVAMVQSLPNLSMRITSVTHICQYWLSRLPKDLPSWSSETLRCGLPSAPVSGLDIRGSTRETTTLSAFAPKSRRVTRVVVGSLRNTSFVYCILPIATIASARSTFTSTLGGK
mmetsp:Transcript_122265/g.280069  ORF Transcript_122265/g.280069 Transcript_122265/m.280069 type:complete len:208 (-) Transcript_122265:3669-4292(-)